MSKMEEYGKKWLFTGVKWGLIIGAALGILSCIISGGLTLALISAPIIWAIGLGILGVLGGTVYGAFKDHEAKEAAKPKMPSQGVAVQPAVQQGYVPSPQQEAARSATHHADAYTRSTQQRGGNSIT